MLKLPNATSPRGRQLGAFAALDLLREIAQRVRADHATAPAHNFPTTKASAVSRPNQEAQHATRP